MGPPTPILPGLAVGGGGYGGKGVSRPHRGYISPRSSLRALGPKQGPEEDAGLWNPLHQGPYSVLIGEQSLTPKIKGCRAEAQRVYKF